MIAVETKRPITIPERIGVFLFAPIIIPAVACVMTIGCMIAVCIPGFKIATKG